MTASASSAAVATATTYPSADERGMSEVPLVAGGTVVVLLMASSVWGFAVTIDGHPDRAQAAEPAPTSRPRRRRRRAIRQVCKRLSDARAFGRRGLQLVHQPARLLPRRLVRAGFARRHRHRRLVQTGRIVEHAPDQEDLADGGRPPVVPRL